jgi:cephalosporin hydroxylase
VKITIDTATAVVTSEDDGETLSYPMASAEAFALASAGWLRAGWDTKYVYSFTWLGRPMIQLPDDMLRIQEVVYEIKPDVILETGVAHGGSLVFYATLCKVMGTGRVIGVDVEIRPHNRVAIEGHELAGFITLIEGDSVAPSTVDAVKDLIRPGEKVLVLLDSLHTKDHVLAELKAYAPLVSGDSYVVAMDGIMESVAGAPRTEPRWAWDNPRQAVREFLAGSPEFEAVEPPFRFNEGLVRERVTYWPSAFLRRTAPSPG